MVKLLFKIFSCLALMLSLSSCIFIHKQDIQQGNIISAERVNQLRPGMTEPQVREIMGTAVLTNIFTPERIDYVYTFQPGHGNMSITRVALIFSHGKLKEIIRG